MNVRERETCRVNADSGFMVARVWEEARKAMLTQPAHADGAPLFAEWIEYDRQLDSAARVVKDSTCARRAIHHARISESVPPEVLDSAGYVVVDSGATSYFVPMPKSCCLRSFRGGALLPARERSVWAEQLDRCPISTDARSTRHARDRRTLGWIGRRRAPRARFQLHEPVRCAQQAHPGGESSFCDSPMAIG
jgi:hypothetical protein